MADAVDDAGGYWGLLERGGGEGEAVAFRGAICGAVTGGEDDVRGDESAGAKAGDVAEAADGGPCAGLAFA